MFDYKLVKQLEVKKSNGNVRNIEMGTEKMRLESMFYFECSSDTWGHLLRQKPVIILASNLTLKQLLFFLKIFRFATDSNFHKIGRSDPREGDSSWRT